MERPTYPRALLHALATALATDVRILGIMTVALTLGMVGLELLLRPAAERAKQAALLLVLSPRFFAEAF